MWGANGAKRQQLIWGFNRDPVVQKKDKEELKKGFNLDGRNAADDGLASAAKNRESHMQILGFRKQGEKRIKKKKKKKKKQRENYNNLLLFYH